MGMCRQEAVTLVSSAESHSMQISSAVDRSGLAAQFGLGSGLNLQQFGNCLLFCPVAPFPGGGGWPSPTGVRVS